eukprot:NODE_503_length_782_cov_416.506870_g494_i0.p1 GENE.NODE_503_length_782_cov_416.506870_g494_i0~~NODE_503_length_782_cov_416.506870_g494_i0.p1  ORF type:complete len:199 (-),score=48.41 NODE_503_length_782_cov_416.506870_g494_i0:55-651(-)
MVVFGMYMKQQGRPPPWSVDSSSYPGTAQDLFPPPQFRWIQLSMSHHCLDGMPPEGDHFVDMDTKAQWIHLTLHGDSENSESWVLQTYDMRVGQQGCTITAEPFPNARGYHGSSAHQSFHFTEEFPDVVIVSLDSSVPITYQFQRVLHEDMNGEDVFTVSFCCKQREDLLVRWTDDPTLVELFFRSQRARRSANGSVG